MKNKEIDRCLHIHDEKLIKLIEAYCEFNGILMKDFAEKVITDFFKNKLKED